MSFEHVRRWLADMDVALFNLTAKKRHPIRSVRCVWCGFAGHACTPSTEEGRGTQGDNVASSAWRGTGETVATPRGPVTFDANTWYLKGHYGSSHFDTYLFRFVKNAPTERADPVCDDCIQRRVDAGDLEQIDGCFP